MENFMQNERQEIWILQLKATLSECVEPLHKTHFTQYIVKCAVGKAGCCRFLYKIFFLERVERRLCVGAGKGSFCEGSFARRFSHLEPAPERARIDSVVVERRIKPRNKFHRQR